MKRIFLLLCFLPAFFTSVTALAAPGLISAEAAPEGQRPCIYCYNAALHTLNTCRDESPSQNRCRERFETATDACKRLPICHEDGLRWSEDGSRLIRIPGKS